MKIVHLLFCLFFIPSVCLVAQVPKNDILKIIVDTKTGGFEFQCNKHLNILPNNQQIMCSIGFQKNGTKDNKKIFQNYIGLSNFSFTGKDKGNYTVVFHLGDCRVFYVFNYKGEVPKIEEVRDCKKWKKSLDTAMSIKAFNNKTAGS